MVTHSCAGRAGGIALAAGLIFAALPLDAQGQRNGWCNGVGNKHQSSSNCGGSGIPTATGGPTGTAVPPTATQTGTTGTGTPTPAQTTGTASVPQAVPQSVPQIAPGQVPTPVPQAVPQAVPQRVPQQVATPGQVPQPVPNAIPQTIPTSTPNQLAQGTPTLVPVPRTRPGPAGPTIVQPSNGGTLVNVTIQRPKLRPPQEVKRRVTTTGPGAVMTGTVRHVPQPTERTQAPGFITERPGRQPAHRVPTYRVTTGNGGRGGDVHCLASGFGARRAADGSTYGNLRHEGNVDALARDLPARHPGRSGCMIAVQRRGN